MTTPRGLTRIPLHMLEQVLGLLERGRLEFPVTAGDLVDAGFHGRATDVAEALAGVDRSGAEAALRIAIAERVYRPPPRLELVWTGPETRASIARSTALVVERLFNEATRCVIIGGYRFDTKEILEPLCRAMTERGVTAMIFVDIDGATPNPADADTFATAFIDKWLRDVWPPGVTKPEIYYDPRTAVRGDVPGYDWATLHAKCVVADDEKSFITSANFTDRGQTRNIEAGVLITDPAFSEQLAGHWRQLVSAGLVRRYRG